MAQFSAKARCDQKTKDDLGAENQVVFPETEDCGSCGKDCPLLLNFDNSKYLEVGVGMWQPMHHSATLPGVLAQERKDRKAPPCN